MNENKMNLPKWAIPVIGVLVAAIVVTTLFLTGVIGPKTVEVPDIINLSAEKAQEIIEDAGLTLSITKKEINEKLDENTVLKQSPASGEKIKKGETVSIVVSEKPVIQEIPNVVSYQRDLAVKALKNLGFKVEIIEKETDEFADGSVIEQSKTGKGKTGDVIVITVAKNVKQSEDKLIKVPDIKGKTLVQAREVLKGNFYVMISGEEYSDTVKKGAIMSQNPVAGTEAKTDTVINVVISKGKVSDTKITVVSVEGLPKKQAEETLKNLGLKVKVENKFSDAVPVGAVISQSIPKGKVVSAQTEITIFVSKGKKPADPSTAIITTTTAPATTTNPSQNVTTTTTTRPTTTDPQSTVPAGEGQYIADFAIATDKSTASAGDIITVSVKLKTNYKIAAVSLPVIYDARVYEIVGADSSNVSSFLTFAGSLKTNGYETNGNWKSPDSMYGRTSNPDKWLNATTKANYKIAFATWTAIPSQGTVVTTLDNEETIVTFKLKVKEGVKNTSGQIFISQDFKKTASNLQGILSVGRLTSDTITADSIVATGQTIDLRDATKTITIN